MSKKKFKKMKQDDAMLAYAMFFDGKTYEQIMAATGMPKNVVRSRIKQGEILYAQRVMGVAP